MKLKVDQHFPGVALERFVEVYFSDSFNESAGKLSGLKSRALVETRERADGCVERRVRMVPAVSLPGPIQKLVGDKEISYDEVSVYDPKRQQVDFHIESAAGDRARFAGCVRFVVENGGVRRVIEADITVNVFAVGGLVERFIESETAKGYVRIGEHMREILSKG